VRRDQKIERIYALWLFTALAVLGALGWYVSRRAGVNDVLVLRYEDPEGTLNAQVDREDIRFGPALRYRFERMSLVEDHWGSPAVGLWFTKESAIRLLADTSDSKGSRLGIVLGGRVVSTQRIDDPIQGSMLLGVPEGWSATQLQDALRERPD
jgi:hypothetical protein